MTQRALLTAFLLLLAGQWVLGQRPVTGRVLDARNGEPVPFAVVRASAGGGGTAADLHGRFDLQVPSVVDRLQVGCIGYHTREVLLPAGDSLLVLLEPAALELRAFDVRPEQDPAVPLIAAAIAKRELNNGPARKAHRFRSYARTVFTLDVDSTLLADTTRIAALPAADREAVRFARRQHVLLMESATRVSARPPDQRTEEVMAMRVSGLEDPSLLAVAASSRSWSVYDALIALNERRFPGPLSPGATDRYRYVLEDTVALAGDTVFVIRFHPRKGARFDGLKGVLGIHAGDHAVHHVVAEPCDQQAAAGMRMRQLHRRVGDTWFPVQVESTLYLNTLRMGSYGLVGRIRLDLTDIEPDPALPASAFRGPELVADRMEVRTDAAYWEGLRTVPLDERDRLTYRSIDSLGRAERLDRTVRALDAVLRGAIPCGPLDLPLDRLADYNGYEGFRLGLGLRTNARVSRRFVLGAYAAYGFGDRAAKYGGDLLLRPFSGHDHDLRLVAQRDVVETGGWSFPRATSLLSEEGYRMLYISRMDAVERFEATIGVRLAEGLKLLVGTERADRRDRTGYRAATALGDGVTLLEDRYLTGALTLGLRFAPGERTARLPGRLVVIRSGRPEVQFTAWRSVPGLWGAAAGVSYSRVWRTVMQVAATHRGALPSFGWRVVAGMADPRAPAPFLFNMRGTASDELGVSTPWAFETMRPNSFVADRFVALHLRFCAGPVLWRHRLSRPEPVLLASSVVGGLRHPELHAGWSFQAPAKGYHEVGFALDSLLRSGFVGIGLMGALRLGPYATGMPAEDGQVKLTLSLIL